MPEIKAVPSPPAFPAPGSSSLPSGSRLCGRGGLWGQVSLAFGAGPKRARGAVTWALSHPAAARGSSCGCIHCLRLSRWRYVLRRSLTPGRGGLGAGTHGLDQGQQPRLEPRSLWRWHGVCLAVARKGYNVGHANQPFMGSLLGGAWSWFRGGSLHSPSFLGRIP